MIYSILEQVLIFLPLVIGAYITLSLLRLPDFSIESAYLFGAVAAFLAQDLPLPFVLASAIIGGMFVGTIVSLLNQCLHIPYLLAAIVTNGLFHGLTHYFLGSAMKGLQASSMLPEFIFVACVGVGAIGVMILILRSQLGYSLAIYGNNPRFFENHPVSQRYVVFSGVMLAHGLAGISGFLFAQSNGFVDLTMNYGVILLCLTALMIGKLCLRKPTPNIFVPLFGIIAYFIMQQTLLRLGLNLTYFNTFQALFVIGIYLSGHRKQTFSLDHLGV